MWAWLLACAAPPAEDTADPVVGPPQITAFAWACDVDEARWTLAAASSAWSGGGALWLSRDGAYVEQHPVRVVRAEPDGTAEELALELSIAADWRDVSPGASTAFLCAEAPSFRFVLRDRAGEAADCRDSGGDVWSAIDLPDCAVPVGDTGD